MPTSPLPLNELWYQLRESIMPLLLCGHAARWYDRLSLGGTRRPSEAFPGYTRPLNWKPNPAQTWPEVDDEELRELGLRRIDDLFVAVTDARFRLAGTQDALKRYGDLVDQALNPGGRVWSMTLARQLNEVARLLKFLDIAWHLVPFDFKRTQETCESTLPLLRRCAEDVEALDSLGTAASKPRTKNKATTSKARPKSKADKVRDLLMPGNPPYQGTKEMLAKEVGYTHQTSLISVKNFHELWATNQERLAGDAQARRQIHRRPV